ncbi:hypothetical protein [Hymenobacter properus]|uniref:DUF6311 domain-containing protein n=1 Tax=Hymenobacter properus TaxID=2791026 RepID=A0A931FMG5_9BACT|nr:hypothetical protein [Hymenobacter properus]MBF9143086.1 hypothetical protein [Hymenobacter properus]MBR7721894.1 hypothetical protein [Microvirga sp. SRT04]
MKATILSAFRKVDNASFSLRKVGLTAVLLQALVLGLTYSLLLFNPGKYLTSDHYDGTKSYFSIATFLQQPMGDGMLVRGHNYPFGEYMYYTDSAPIVVAPLHALVQAVPALAPYGLYIYDLFILSSLVISTGLLVLMLHRLGLPAWFVVLLSVALPWLNPQAVRLNVGHMNLTYTPAILFVLWRLQVLYAAWRAGAPLARQFVVLLVGIVLAAWIHFYYLALMLGTMGFFVLVLLYQSVRAGRPWRPLLLGMAGVAVGAVALTWGLLQALDPRIHERPVGSNGYDWIEWRFQFTALFKGYVYNKVQFPLERTSGVPYESSAYLTSFVLFGLLLVGVLLLLKRLPAEARLPQPSADATEGFLQCLLLACVPMAFIALGENIDLDNGNYVLHNYLNVFRWLHKVTDRVTQFRALGRFIWPFWWAVVLCFSWYVARWRFIPRLRWALLVLVALLVVDTVNATHFYRTQAQAPNLLRTSDDSPVRTLLGWPAKGRYQAILPIPFYHVGTDWSDEPTNLNLDPDDPLCNTTYQLSMVSGLPLMAHKAARAITGQAEALYSVFQPGGPSPALLERLDQRPILVYLDTAYYDGRNNYYRDMLRDRPTMRAVFERAPAFIQEQHMVRIAHQGSQSLYEWFPKGQPTPGPASR